MGVDMGRDRGWGRKERREARGLSEFAREMGGRWEG